VAILAELRDLDDVPADVPAFVEESMRVLLGLAEREPDVDVLAEVARAFGYRRDPRGVRPLLAWRDHPAQPMRFFVACALPRCRTVDNEEQVVGALIELTDDEDGAVRDYALFGLHELRVDSAEVREAMLRHVRDPDSSAAGQALVGLATLGDERVIEPLNEYLRHAPASDVASYGREAEAAYADARRTPAPRASPDPGRPVRP
jgi:HEAT repeat protein